MALKAPSTTQLASFRSMKSVADLSRFLGTTEKRIIFGSTQDKGPRYQTLRIPKRSGGHRTLYKPPKLVRGWQVEVLRCLSEIFTPRSNSHGFVRRRSIVSNARSHLRQRLVLTLDLAEFFETIHFGRVRGIFSGHPFNFPYVVATVLGQLCCYQGRLPQGAPTSPILANLACRGLDTALAHLANRHRCRYSRYADDITFSTRKSHFDSAICANEILAPGDTPILGDALVAIIETKHKFRINEAKTRIRFRSQRQEVTGLTVNDGSPNVRRSYVMQIRSALYNWRTSGRAAAEDKLASIYGKHRRGGTPGIENFVSGKLNFLSMVRGNDDPIFARYAIELRDQQRREDVHHLPLPIFGRSHEFDKLLIRAIWVIQGLDNSGDALTQGTAFYLEGVGFVTSRHVLDFGDDVLGTPTQWRLQHGEKGDPDGQMQVIGAQKHSHYDIAVLVTTKAPSACLRRAEGSPIVAVRQKVTVAGYPKWNTTADGMALGNGRIVQLKRMSKIDFLLADVDIRGGNSGGPMLDQDGLVVGVATYDSSNSMAPNSAISIDHLNKVHGLPVTAI